jgi:hypothetical protein
MSVTYTSLAKALNVSDTRIYLTSSSGVAKNTTVLNIQDEILTVLEVLNGGVVKVFRGAAGTRAAAHSSGVSVSIGAPSDFGDVASQIQEQSTPREVSETYDGARSHQSFSADLTLEPTAGKAADTSFLAAFMGNLFGDTLTRVANYLAGLIGFYSVTGTGASTYPKAGVLGGIGDGSTDADGAVVGLIDGDSAVTRAGAIFKARTRNSTGGSGADYGLDLQDPGTDGFSELLYAKAPVRMAKDVCFLVGAGAPVDYGAGPPIVGTGNAFAGIGSLYADITNGKLYINGGTLAQPVWKIITSA